MSAADRFVRGGVTPPGPPVPAAEPDPEPRTPFDHARAQEVVAGWLCLVGAVAATVGGAYLLADAFAGWVGALLVLVVVLLGLGFVWAKAEQRRAEQRQRDEYAARQERTAIPGPSIPRLD